MRIGQCTSLTRPWVTYLEDLSCRGAATPLLYEDCTIPGAELKVDELTWPWVTYLNKYDKNMFSVRLIRDRRSSKSDKETPPDFITKPRRQFVEEGQTAKFKASYDGPPSTKLTWSKNGKPITNDKQHRIYCENDVHYLDICAVTSDDGGQYTCTLQSPSGTVTASAELEVFVRPKSASRKDQGFVSPQVDVPLTDMYVSNGERNVKMECKFSNAIDATCVWRRNGQKLNSSYLSKQTFDGRLATLTLSRITDRETGSYECEASSSGGSAVTKATLSISDPTTRHIPPKFVTPLSDHTLAPGESVVLESRVTGFPKPTIKWYRNKQEIKSTKSVKIEFDNPVVRLTMSNVQISDSDTYKCVAENDAGSDQIKATITVKGASSQGEPPIFVKELTDMDADEGDKVELVVEVKGTFPIYVAWLHREREIPINDHDFRIFSDKNVHKLIIPEVFLEDSGKFICEVYNDHGDTETFCNLNVRETDNSLCMQQTSETNNESSAVESLDQSDSDKSYRTSRSDSGFVEQFGQKPDFVLKPRSVEVDHGLSAIFLCRPTGNPPPTVIWRKQGELIQNDNKHRISVGVDCYLEIRSVTTQDSGVYTCELTNLLGSVTTETDLIVRNSISEKSSPSDVRSLLRKSSLPNTPPTSIKSSSPMKSTDEKKEPTFVLTKMSKLQHTEETTSRLSENKNSFSSLKQTERKSSAPSHSGSVSKQIDRWQKLEQKPPKSPVNVDYRSVLKSASEK
ncbi:hypothetical protein FSP39_012120 [Pinctada imbricata]|uniref:Ig-like domain-containing protein n=1 Tax=Pinctada imbricata TaxID=66713 RepID=A0AA88XCX1_PINIB|nr:hypothetical protein FSP39_012120 [Pinctada imbricata]